MILSASARRSLPGNKQWQWPRNGRRTRGRAGGEGEAPRHQRRGWWWYYQRRCGIWEQRETRGKAIGRGPVASAAAVLEGLLLRQGHFAPAGRGFPPFREYLALLIL